MPNSKQPPHFWHPVGPLWLELLFVLLADRASLAKTASIHSMTRVTALLNNLLMFQGNPRGQIYDNQAYVRPLLNKYTAFRKTCIIASSIYLFFLKAKYFSFCFSFINIIILLYYYFINFSLQASSWKTTTHIIIWKLHTQQCMSFIATFVSLRHEYSLLMANVCFINKTGTLYCLPSEGITSLVIIAAMTSLWLNNKNALWLHLTLLTSDSQNLMPTPVI